MSLYRVVYCDVLSCGVCIVLCWVVIRYGHVAAALDMHYPSHHTTPSNILHPPSFPLTPALLDMCCLYCVGCIVVRYGHVAAALDAHRMVVFGGRGEHGRHLGDTWVYDYRYDTWQVRTHMLHTCNYSTQTYTFSLTPESTTTHIRGRY